MGNTFSLPLIRLVQRVSMILTLCCCVYVFVFLFSKNQDQSVLESPSVLTKGAVALAPSETFDLKLYNPSANTQTRDIFSLTPDTAAPGAVANTPKGQLPANLKVVGIVVSKPSQIIIEDSSANTTYFVTEGNPQGSIKIVKVSPDQMVINYQGQDIDVPIAKN